VNLRAKINPQNRNFFTFHRPDRSIVEEIPLRTSVGSSKRSQRAMCMLIHTSHFRSILNLGVCKEYLIMPKPKNPKKTNGVEVSAVHNVVPKVDSVSETAAAPVAERNIDMQTDMQTAASRKTRKPEIVKAEPRSNLIPINLEHEIRQLAYLLSERRGFQPGHETEDWLSAEREVLDRYHQQSA
jgi:hypothetical protein